MNFVICYFWYLKIYRSSLPKALCKKSVFRNFAKFIGKHLCQRLFLNKVAGLRSSEFNYSLWNSVCLYLQFIKGMAQVFNIKLSFRKKRKLRILWRLSTTLKTSSKSVWSNIFWYVKVCIFWKCIQYTLYIEIKHKY